MKVRHIQNGNYYLLTNFAASGNPIFLKSEDVKNFKKRVFKHLEGLCKILESAYENDHFKLLVLMKSRENFIKFYRLKKGNMDIIEEDIPDSTYILSQEMANIQSGYAKWFNYKYKRFGVVFGRRFTKIFIESKEALIKWAKEMWNGTRYWKFKEEWSYKNCKLFWRYGKRIINAGEIYLDSLPNELRGQLGNSS